MLRGREEGLNTKLQISYPHFYLTTQAWSSAHPRTLPLPGSPSGPQDTALHILLPNGLHSWSLLPASPPVFHLLVCVTQHWWERGTKMLVPPLEPSHNCSFSGRKKRDTRFIQYVYFLIHWRSDLTPNQKKVTFILQRKESDSSSTTVMLWMV